MSINSWSLVRFLHVTAAMTWVGGQLLLTAIVLPALRSTLGRPAMVPVIHSIARRFAVVANFGLLPGLLVTGLALAWHRGVTFGTFSDPGYGRLLGIKLALVAASVVLAVVHGAAVSRNPRAARPLALGGVGASLGIVLFATALVP